MKKSEILHAQAEAALESIIPHLTTANDHKRGMQIMMVLAGVLMHRSSYAVDIFQKNDRQVTVMIHPGIPLVTVRMLCQPKLGMQWVRALPKLEDRKLHNNFFIVEEPPKQEVPERKPFVPRLVK